MRKLMTTAAVLVMLPLSAIAEPAVGFGLTFKMGKDEVDPGLALRLFSDNRQNRVAGTLGIDYLFRSKSFRPTLGASYVGDDVFFGFDFGLGSGFSSGGINTGFSAGYVNSFGPVVTPPVVTPPVVTPAVVTPPVVTPPVVTPPVVTPPVTPPPERPPANAAFLEEENMDIIIGGETDFA